MTRSSSVGEAVSTSSATIDATCDMAGFPRLIHHLQQPQHLLIYLVLSAWLKYMDILSWLPSVSIG